MEIHLVYFFLLLVTLLDICSCICKFLVFTICHYNLKVYWNNSITKKCIQFMKKKARSTMKKKTDLFSTKQKLQNIFINIYRLAITHLAPKLDKVVVIPLPIPVPPPVIKATFPWNIFGGNITFWRGEKNAAWGALLSWCSTFDPWLKNWKKKKKRGKLFFSHICIQDCYARLDFLTTAEVRTITALA